MIDADINNSSAQAGDDGQGPRRIAWRQHPSLERQIAEIMDRATREIAALIKGA